MRFTLIDRIVELEPGSHITAQKNLSLAEEYLADHFPGFPVMPGVLMLEAMTQAGAWLIRATDDFAHSMVLLKEARNVKYGTFVEPGQTLTLTAEIVSREEGETRIKAKGTVDGVTAVSGRLLLEHYDVVTRNPTRVEADAVIKQNLRELLAQLWQPSAAAT